MKIQYKHKQSMFYVDCFCMFISKIIGAINLIEQKRLTTVAGAWVYYFLISAVPLAFLFVTAFSVFGVDITEQLVARLPIEFRSAGQVIVNTAKNATEGVTIFFIGTVIFSCTTVLNQMSKDGEYIYGVQSKRKRGILRRLWALIALGTLFSLFLSLAILFTFGNTLGLGGIKLNNNTLLLTTCAFFCIIIFSYIIILALNKFVCPYRQRFSQIAIGGLVSLFIIVLGTIFFIIYVRFFASYNIFYGSLAGIIIFLLWTYIVMLGLALGVIINSKLTQNKRSVLNVKNSKLYKTIW